AFDLLPVDLCAIGAARIFDGPLTIVKDEARMVARDGAIEDQDIVARRAANGRDILMQQETTPRQQAIEEGQTAAQWPPIRPGDAIHLGASAREIIAAEGAETVLWIVHRATAETGAGWPRIPRRNRHDWLQSLRRRDNGDPGGA